MVLAVKISPEELLEDFDKTVLTQNKNVCITNLKPYIRVLYKHTHIISENKWQDSADGNNGPNKFSL